MVVSRLEARQKSGLEVETAANLAGVCGWTLGQLCGLEPVPDIPAPPPAYTLRTEGRPAWLADELPTTTEYRPLAAHILAWQLRGAPWGEIAACLTTWGVRPFVGGQTWNAERVRQCATWFGHTKKAQGALLREFGLHAEARQLAARRTRR